MVNIKGVSLINPAYIGVAIIGLLHGLEPGHGWPIALLYSARKRNPLFSGFLSSGIIAVAHFVSSIAVVIAYVLLRTWLDFDAPFIEYIAVGILVILAIKMFLEKPEGLEKQHGHIHEELTDIEHEHEHEHPTDIRHTHPHKHITEVIYSLWGLATFAFILGFAHEEEFALLALVASGVNAWVLMIIYGLSVTVSLIGITILAIRIYKLLQTRLIRYEKYVPRITGAILIVMAAFILFL